MRAKLMTSAAVLAGVLAFATVSQAQTGPNGNVGGNTTATDSYNDTDVDIDDSLNDNRDYDVDDSFNDNRDYDDSFNSVDTDVDLDVDLDDSFNDNSTDIDTDDSFNDNRDYDDSFNDNRDYDDSFNDNREYDSEVDIEDSLNDNRDYDDSFNDNRDYSTEVDIEDSFNDNRDYDDSFNTDNSRTNLDLRLSLNLQELSANVSNLSFDMSEDNGGNQNARIRTGDINQQGGAFAGFAGIQTVSNNTGLASIGQAATAVSANANVTFGGSGN